MQEPELWPNGATKIDSSLPVGEVDALPPVVGAVTESWERQSARICLRRRTVGFHYEVDGAQGQPLGDGWRLTASGAKRAARRRIRRVQAPVADH